MVAVCRRPSPSVWTLPITEVTNYELVMLGVREKETKSHKFSATIFTYICIIVLTFTYRKTTTSIEQSPSGEANSRSGRQEFFLSSTET
jgi:hypothetical protein